MEACFRKVGQDHYATVDDPTYGIITLRLYCARPGTGGAGYNLELTYASGAPTQTYAATSESTCIPVYLVFYGLAWSFGLWFVIDPTNCCTPEPPTCADPGQCLTVTAAVLPGVVGCEAVCSLLATPATLRRVTGLYAQNYLMYDTLPVTACTPVGGSTSWAAFCDDGVWQVIIQTDTVDLAATYTMVPASWDGTDTLLLYRTSPQSTICQFPDFITIEAAECPQPPFNTCVDPGDCVQLVAEVPPGDCTAICALINGSKVLTRGAGFPTPYDPYYYTTNYIVLLENCIEFDGFPYLGEIYLEFALFCDGYGQWHYYIIGRNSSSALVLFDAIYSSAAPWDGTGSLKLYWEYAINGDVCNFPPFVTITPIACPGAGSSSSSSSSASSQSALPTITCCNGRTIPTLCFQLVSVNSGGAEAWDVVAGYYPATHYRSVLTFYAQNVPGYVTADVDWWEVVILLDGFSWSFRLICAPMYGTADGKDQWQINIYKDGVLQVSGNSPPNRALDPTYGTCDPFDTDFLTASFFVNPIQWRWFEGACGSSSSSSGGGGTVLTTCCGTPVPTTLYTDLDVCCGGITGARLDYDPVGQFGEGPGWYHTRTCSGHTLTIVWRCRNVVENWWGYFVYVDGVFCGGGATNLPTCNPFSWSGAVAITANPACSSGGTASVYL